MPIGEHSYWNVNLPAVEAARSLPLPSLCSVDPTPFEFRLEDNENTVVYRGDYHNRPRAFGSDVAICFSGIPSVTEMSIREFR